MELGIGASVWFEGRPGVVIEGPDEDGQFEIEFVAGDDLDRAWFLPSDRRVTPRR
ncbi:hypothetical protein [Leifsonia sp. AG29]|uniref:hypothetical protein n=1 Tax=Leifsonia sp. AG29 TaxID=2598860 RepID=UPI00131E1D8B|nr:hypothetical protein [Leifsonia sp. AG29]